MHGNETHPPPASAPTRRRPEILAPAGDVPAFRAALAAGAGAVYVGMARFNARGRADRFRGEALRACIGAAHERGARVYVTLNTLVHDDELSAALALAAEAQAAGADAAIVQDAGFAALLRRHLRSFPLHGSTQMTIHQAEQAAAAVERLGLARVILARECSLAEVGEIAARLRPLGAEVEVFVHGALCFAYSGQCLMSNFAGRRSANRGICAQNCRFDFTARPPAASRGPYVPLPVFARASAEQLISMKDLAAFGAVGALAGAGVGSFKIEGRLKGPSYVAEVVRLYRAALDAWEAGETFDAAAAERVAGRVYSRGFTNGYLEGRIDASMRGDKRRLEGEPDAVVLAANRKRGEVTLAPRPGHAVRAGQGYRYAHGRYRGGFRVLHAAPAPRPGRAAAGYPDFAAGQPVLARVRFGAEAAGRSHRRGARGRRRPPPPLPEGLPVHMNDDPELEKRIGAIVGAVEIATGPAPVPLRLEVEGQAGAPLRARAVAADGSAAEAESAEALEPARSRPLDAACLEEHLGRLGGTGYRLEGLTAARLAPDVFLGLAALHAVRRELVAGLDRQAERAPAAPRAAVPGESFHLPEPEPAARRTRLAVCAGSPEALRAAVGAGADRGVVEDPLLVEGDRARERAWAEVLADAGETWFRLPPIAHDGAGDGRALERLRALAPRAGLVAGHLGQLARAARLGIPAAADLYLNAYNFATVRLLGEAGARRVTLSLEVEAREAASVAARAGAAPEVEVVVGGGVFSMLTRQEYGLESGTRFHAVSEHGHAYRFEAAAGGGTLLYEARELVGVEALPLLAGRVDSVRLDFAHHGPGAVAEITGAYRAALDGLGADDALSAENERERLIAAALEAHRRHAPHGAFAGHLFRGARRLDAPPGG